MTALARTEHSVAAPIETSRTERIRTALSYYTDTLGLTITPIHVPFTTPPVNPDTHLANGIADCSCGKQFILADGRPDKSSPATHCTSPGKHPIFRGFFADPAKQAITSSAATRLWQTALTHHPDRADAPWNIGIVTGKSTGLVVVDVDVRSGGLTSMTALDEAFAHLECSWRPSATFSYLTSGNGQRGYHLYFSMDRDDAAIWKSLIALGETVLPGVEVKWRPGIVVAAPSLHATGAVYDLTSTAPIQQLDAAKLTDFTRALAIAKGQSVEEARAIESAPVSWTDRTFVSGIGWRDSGTEKDPKGAHHLDGHWPRQIEYLHMTGSPSITYGPSEHAEAIKRLFGAAVGLYPPPPSLAFEIYQQLQDRTAWMEKGCWLPAFYGSMFMDIDAAVTQPEPWIRTDPSNWYALARNALFNEVQHYGYATATASSQK